MNPRKNGQNLLFANQVLILACLSCTGKWAGSDCLFPVYQMLSLTGQDKQDRTGGTTDKEPARAPGPAMLTESLLSLVALLLCEYCLHSLLRQTPLQRK